MERQKSLPYEDEVLATPAVPFPDRSTIYDVLPSESPGYCLRKRKRVPNSDFIIHKGIWFEVNPYLWPLNGVTLCVEEPRLSPPSHASAKSSFHIAVQTKCRNVHGIKTPKDTFLNFQ
jgi:hypothetical protein